MDDQRVNSWRATEPGEQISGKLVRFDEYLDKRDRPQRVAIVETASELRAIWIFKSTTQYVFSKSDPQTGDYITLTRVEDRVLDDGRSFERYALDVQRAKPAASNAQSQRDSWPDEAPF